MNAAPDKIVYATPQGHVLLLRRPEVWGLPSVGEVPGEFSAEPWTHDTVRTDVAAAFNPSDDPAAFQWVHHDFVRSCPPSAFDASVPPAMRRFDGPPLDQIMARIGADSTLKSGDPMPTAESLQLQIDALKRQVGPDHSSDGMRNQFRAAQDRGDAVVRAYGDSNGAPPPVNGESLLDYRARLAAPFQKYSTAYKDSNLARVRDSIALEAVEGKIYQDAMTALRTGAGVPAGTLRAIVRRDATGLARFKDFVGDPGAAWAPFKRSWLVKSFGVPGSPGYKQCF